MRITPGNMPRWKYTLDIKAEHQAIKRFLDFEEDDIDAPGDRLNPEEGAARIAAKVRHLRGLVMLPGDAANLERIAMEFDEVEDVEDYDDALKSLYDWADFARCWVATF